MIEAIKNRRSVRKFDDFVIPGKALDEWISAASCAPSVFNLQPWHFSIITNKGKKQQIREIYDQATKRIKFFKKLRLTSVPIYNQDTEFLEKATLIVPSYDVKVPYARDSLAMAVQNLMLEVEDSGFGSVCVGRSTTFSKGRKQIKKIAEVGKNYEIPYIIAVGYKSEDNELIVSKRKPASEIMTMVGGNRK